VRLHLQIYGFLKNNFLFVIVILFTIFARFYKLGWDESNDDATFWFSRSEKLFDLWKQDNFSIMPDYQYPGIPVYAITQLFLNIAGFVIETIRGYRFPFFDPIYFPIYNLFAKLPIQIIYIGFISYFYFVSLKTIGKRAGLISSALLSLEPFYDLYICQTKE
jgi:hypothetical protein